ncbi:MAG: hypothetical protein AB9835_00445 [Eubacteriales bacterium]
MKRLIALIMSLLIVLAATFGCSSEKAGVIATTETPTDITPQTTQPISTLPAKDFEGKAIRFLVSTETLWGYDLMDAESETGEAVNDAVYRRNSNIEERYNVVISQEGMKYSDFQSKVSASIKAGSLEFEVVLPRLNYGAVMAQDGNFLNVKELPYIDLTQSWWDNALERDLSVDDKLYFLAGDIHMYANDATWIYMFNKQLQKDLGIEDLYALVRDGKWTLDAFNKVISDVTSDIDGDSKITGEDRVGMVTMNLTINSLLYGANARIFQKTDDGYEMNINTEHFNSAFDKVLKIFNDDNNTLAAENTSKWKVTKAPGSRMIGDDIKYMFASGKALLVPEVVDCISRYRDIDFDFGVLPTPKLDEAQESYYSMVVPDAMVLSVPVTCADTEMVGFILEAMAQESSTTVLPAYYETTLQRKHSRDAESADMLDIIFKNRIYPLDLLYGWSGVTADIQTAVNKNANTLSSIYESKQEKAKSAIQKTLENYLGI